MIIDLILDRKGSNKYDTKAFYQELKDYTGRMAEVARPIILAIESGNEQQVVDALCRYIKEQEWPERICEYVKSVKWLNVKTVDVVRIEVTFPKKVSSIHERERYEPEKFIFEADKSKSMWEQSSDAFEEACRRGHNPHKNIRMHWLDESPLLDENGDNIDVAIRVGERDDDKPTVIPLD